MDVIKKYWLVSLLFLLLIYTRFLNLNWGLPYPFHPDERNIALSLQQLHCNITSFKLSDLQQCLNPHFFAYGQFPLYLGFIGVVFWKLLSSQLNSSISFNEAVLSLRAVAALASVVTVYYGLKIIKQIELKGKGLPSWVYLLLLIFSPALIQSAHFGTTESLLMMFYTLIIYLTLLFYKELIAEKRFILLSSLILGLAIGTKVSSLIFVFLPLYAIYSSSKRSASRSSRLISFARTTTLLISLTAIFTFIFSPQNFISWNEFTGSMNYESAVALGRERVFYTRQFENTIPVLFQITNIFPYVLGLPVFLLFAFSLFMAFLKKRNKELNILLLGFFIYFIPNAFLFAKWSRFMAPIFPLMIVIASLPLIKIKNRFLLWGIILVSIVPGIAYLSVYANGDIRLTTSSWIYKNIPANSYILSETGNVVDIPIADNTTIVQPMNYSVVSFNFYDLEQDKNLQLDLSQEIKKADYIFVPSRRIFKNINKKNYPLLSQYYSNLFNGDYGFNKVAEFNSFPKISLFGKTLIEFPDENAEETWTVFDHPVIRIYKK